MYICTAQKCEYVHFFAYVKEKKQKRTDAILSDKIILRMKEIRKNNGHTQEYVFENTGLDIAHVEVGRVIPSVVSISIFCKFYNITLDEFFAPLNYPPKE
jgi:hypothetical protein